MSATPDLLEFLKTDRRRIRSEVALHAARVLIVQPEQLADMTALTTLLHIPYVTESRADALLRAAEVYPLRRGGDLREERRIAFARTLGQFAKETA